MSEALAIHTLGGLTLRRGGNFVTGFTSRKAEALLVYLACTARSHSREFLAELFWEERSQAQSMGNLRQVLFDLRQRVDPYVTITRQMVAMNQTATCWLDIAELETCLTQASKQWARPDGLSNEAARHLEEALALYKGDFLAGFSIRDCKGFDEWVVAERERLRREVIDALHHLVSAYLDSSAYTAGIAQASRLLQLDLLSEEGHRQLMVLLVRTGQRGAALAQYETCRRLLADELGVKPTSETVALYEEIRAGAPSIEMMPARGPQSIAPDKDIAEPRNPYKGLRAFREADAADFFGRETLIERMIQRLGEAGEPSRFLAVIGPSGSGKSSLVKAGLIPALRRGAIPGAERWLVIEILPGTHPLEQLEIALIRVAAGQADNLHGQLIQGERGLLRAAQLLLPDNNSQLLLVIDQFEEVFTLVEDEQARVHFLNNLATAASDPRNPIRIVVTLRADFFDRPLRYARFGELVRRNMEIMLPLTADELERAIVRPAEQVGVTFEPGLVASIIDEVNHQPGALPLLEYTLTELFERRADDTMTQLTYRAIGGTVGALAQSADDLYNHFESNAQEAARQMFLRLVTLGEGVEDTRRRVLRAELLAIAADSTIMGQVIDAFTVCRLLSLDSDPGTRTPMVEIAHEAILREWGWLRAWLNEARADIRWQRQLAHAAAEWYGAQQDASFLLRGSRLEQLAGWASATALALTPDERAYVQASVVERQRQESAEHERQRQEAALERRSRNVLRALVVVLLIATLGTLALASLAVNQSQVARQNAEEAQIQALASGSQAELANSNTDLAIALALRAIQGDHTSTEAQVALAQAAYAPGTVRRFIGHIGWVNTVAFSPDGRTALSGGADSRIILWDVKTGQEVRRILPFAGNIYGVAFSTDGSMALAGLYDYTLMLLDVQSGSTIRRFTGHRAQVTGVVMSPDGRTALSSSLDGTLILWDIQTGAVVHRFVGHTDQVESVAFSPDGRTALSGSDDKTMILWDIQTGAVIRRFTGHTDIVQSVAFSPDGRTALSGSFDNTMILWDIATGQIIRRFLGHYGAVQAVAFSPDGHAVVSGSADTSIILWNVTTGQIIRRLQGHTDTVNSVVFSPNGRYILSGSNDNTLRLWDLQPGQILGSFAGHSQWVYDVAFSPDGKTTLSGSEDGTAILWDVQTRQELHRFDGDSRVSGVAFSPDGRLALIAAGEQDVPGDVVLWDVKTGQEIRRFHGHFKGVISAAFSPDGQTALSSSWDDQIFEWDVATGRQIRLFDSNQANWVVGTVRFSPDGKTALAGVGDGMITMWDVMTGRIIRSFGGNGTYLSDVALSPDGKSAVAGAIGGTLILWDVETGQAVRSLTAHSTSAFKVAFSPDGRTILAGSADGSVNLWDAATGAILRTMIGPDVGAYSVAFSPDGRTFMVGFTDGTLQLWRDDSLDELLAWTHANRYVPELTCEQHARYRLEPVCDARSNAMTSTP